MQKNSLFLADDCADAFVDQREARPYKEMVAITEQFINPEKNQIWLDLGCGTGRLIQSIWERSGGKVTRIIGLDCSKRAIDLARTILIDLNPPLPQNIINFVLGDLSQPLPFKNESFDGVTAGLAIQYAENWDEVKQCWTKRAYINALREVLRVLKSGGIFVWSTNVPNPNFQKIFWASWKEVFFTRKVFRLIWSGIRCLKYGKWMKEWARKGRFHYLPIEKIVQILNQIGFVNTIWVLTYADQAWVIKTEKSP